MDDIVIFAEDNQGLHEWLRLASNFLEAKLHLKLKSGSIFINRSTHGLPFLGMRIYPGVLRFRRQNLSRSYRTIQQRYREFNRGYIDEENLAECLISSCGYLQYFCPGLAVSIDRRNRTR